MANLPWSYKIKHGQSTNPVIFCCKTKLDKSVPFPNEIELKKVFKADGYKLQTWGRAITEKGKVKLENDSRAKSELFEIGSEISESSK